MLYIVSEYASQGEIFGKQAIIYLRIQNEASRATKNRICSYICRKISVQILTVQNTDFSFHYSFMILLLIKFPSFPSNADYIARYGKMSERSARQKFWQILSAVEYCHTNGIVHRDLKVNKKLLIFSEKILNIYLNALDIS